MFGVERIFAVEGRTPVTEVVSRSFGFVLEGIEKERGGYDGH